MPPQAAPLGAMSTMLVLSEAKVNTAAKVALALFCAVAVSCKVVPACMEKLVPGFSVIFAGKGEPPGGLCPPQAGSNNDEDKIANTAAQADRPKGSFPLHAVFALLSGTRAKIISRKWKICSLENRCRFSKRSTSEGAVLNNGV